MDHHLRGHELGHALMARWLLGTPVSVAVGFSGRLGELYATGGG